MATTHRPDSQDTRRSQKQAQAPAQRRADQDQQRDERQDRDTDETIRNDGVEIGDPVPERDRTVRADSRAQGETGEDEDLPQTGGIEGTRSDRH